MSRLFRQFFKVGGLISMYRVSPFAFSETAWPLKGCFINNQDSYSIHHGSFATSGLHLGCFLKYVAKAGIGGQKWVRLR
jgi:hypothetical protein